MSLTFRQKTLKVLYPLIMAGTKLFGQKSKVLVNTQNKQPLMSFYALKANANSGQLINFDQFKGKKVLIVNVASDCGYTSQYDGLEALYETNRDKLVILGFPTNDFKDQEKGNDTEIAEFCRLNFGVTFPLFKKMPLANSQNEVYQWLIQKSKNGWNSQEPTWNFCKYLIDESGTLTHFFESSVAPDSQVVRKALAL